MWFNVIHVQEYAIYVYPEQIGVCIACFLIIQAPLVPLWRINRRNWLERARPSQQQRETAGAPADNCDRTHHWHSRYRCRDANSNRAQLWAALCIELMTHNLSPCYPHNSNCMYVCVYTYTYMLGFRLRLRIPSFGAGSAMNWPIETGLQLAASTRAIRVH